jgi:hypothetical protein
MSHGFSAQTVKARVQAKTGRAEAVEGVNGAFTTSSGHSGEAAEPSETCQNPVCTNRIEPLPDGWRRTQRRFCSDRCKTNAWHIREAAKLFEGLIDAAVLEIVRGAK